MTTPSPNTIPPLMPATQGLVYLCELDLSDIIAVAHGDLGTVAGRALAAWHEFYSTTAPVAASPFAYFASEDVTFPATDPQAPNRWYDGRLNHSGQIDRSLSLLAAAEPTYTTSFGTVQLANGDGALDTMPDIVGLSNTLCVIKVGYRGAAYSTYQTLATGVIQGVDVGLDTADLILGGVESLLEKAWFDQTYAGTGGIEGPTSLANVRKPFVFGRVFNMGPVLIEPLTYIFQCHAGGALSAVTKVSFGGASLTFTSDVPNYAALLSLSVPIGSYATCLASGLVKAGLTQAGVDGTFSLTVDCETALTTASLNARAVVQAAQVNLNVPFDVTSFDAMEVADGNFAYGFVMLEPMTYSQILSDCMQNMNRYWGINRAGSLATSRLYPAAQAQSSGLEYDEADILDLDRLAPADGFRWPFASQTVKCRKNWSVQTSLVAIVSDPSYGQEFREVTETVTPALVNSLTPDALETNLRTTTSGRLLADRILTLHGEQRFVYSVKVSILSGFPSLTESITLTYPRFGLDGGKQCVVVSSSEDYDNGTVLLTVWA